MSEREGTPEDFARMLGKQSEQPEPPAPKPEPEQHEESSEADVLNVLFENYAARKHQRDAALFQILHPEEQD